MTSLGKITEQVYRRYKGGNPSDDSELDQREVELLVIQVLNQVLKISHVQDNMAIGDMFPPHAMIATYENVAVTAFQSNYAKATLPATPISAPRGMGVWKVYQTNAYFDEFVPAMSGQLGMVKRITHTPISALLSSKRIAYELANNNTLIFYAPAATVGETVNIQLLIVDPLKVGTYDPLPVPPDMEFSIIAEVLKLLGETPPVDKTNDNTDQQ